MGKKENAINGHRIHHFEPSLASACPLTKSRPYTRKPQSKSIIPVMAVEERTCDSSAQGAGALDRELPASQGYMLKSKAVLDCQWEPVSNANKHNKNKNKSQGLGREMSHQALAWPVQIQARRLHPQFWKKKGWLTFNWNTIFLGTLSPDVTGILFPVWVRHSLSLVPPSLDLPTNTF